MSTNELSELIALGCPDLGGGSTNSTQKHIVDEKRRLSVKQMTATELAAARAAAALDIKNALAKAKESAAKVVSAPTTPLPKAGSSNNTGLKIETPAISASAPTTPLTLPATAPNFDNEKNNNISATTINSNHSSPSSSPSEENWEIENTTLPLASAARDRITSLPSILDDGMEDHFLSLSSVAVKPPTELPLKTISSDNNLVASSDSLSNHDISNSPGQNLLEISSSNTSVHSTLMDSIELMRQQRRDRDDNSRERRSGSELDERRIFNNERSAAPDRLHSSSISSIGSAAGGVSATPSLNPSKNHSRRNSNASVVSEISTSVTAILPPTPPPLYPLAKTVSAPNMERRKSSLTSLFPGPSPLIGAEPPTLHTDPIVKEDFSKEEIEEIVQDTLNREIPTGRHVHRTKTPPPVGVSLGVNLKKVTPPRSHITVKKNDAPMLGVVLRKVERKVVQQKSILDDDKPLYKISIVRSDGKEHKPSDQSTKPKPKPVPLQKSATIAAKPNPGGILTGPQGPRPVQHPMPQMTGKNQRPALGVPITIQKIEGDKIIIIKKYIVPKNTKLPEHLMRIGVRIQCLLQCW